MKQHIRKNKEEIKDIIEQSPSLKAYHKIHRSVTNAAISRTFAMLLLLSGIACILFTKQVHHLFPYILGGIMILIGLNHTLYGLWTGEYRSPETKLTAGGIVYIVLGAVILSHHADADAMIGSVWGILGLMKGSEALNLALYCFSQKKPFLTKGLQALIELILGFLLLLNPLSAVRHHIFLLGIELCLVGWQLFRETQPTSAEIPK
ncbi:MAG: DUF308 domain-containing protein [Clostridium sp.]|nr:DUF308 domain-containing protein [Clostridium sp.]